jgi:pimeloyl-ACP methyl ester carboxylesterase
MRLAIAGEFATRQDQVMTHLERVLHAFTAAVRRHRHSYRWHRVLSILAACASGLFVSHFAVDAQSVTPGASVSSTLAVAPAPLPDDADISIRPYRIDVPEAALVDLRRRIRPVVVVGHSYGGAVITGAASGNVNVKALVYFAAFAPDAGEPIGAYLEKYPSALGPALRPDAGGFVYIDLEQFRDVFAKDVPAAEASIMSATQKPVSGTAFGASVGQAAWKTIPSWYVIAQEDRAINPELERFYAKRMGATTSEIKASHVLFMSHPEDIARVIGQAANTPVKAGTR